MAVVLVHLTTMLCHLKSVQITANMDKVYTGVSFLQNLIFLKFYVPIILQETKTMFTTRAKNCGYISRHLVSVRSIVFIR